MGLDLISRSKSRRKLSTRLWLMHSPMPVLILFLLVAFVLPSLACSCADLDEGIEPPYKPETPTQYTAETAAVEVYVPLDEAGNVVPGDGPYAYYATTKLVYVLRFWDVGSRTTGYEKATISRVYTPISIGELHPDLEAGLSAAEQSAIFSRTSFPTSEVPLHELTFDGGRRGLFSGTNSVTGAQITGHLEWENDKFDIGAVHVIFTEGIQQDYIVLGEEVFFNWP